MIDSLLEEWALETLRNCSLFRARNVTKIVRVEPICIAFLAGTRPDREQIAARTALLKPMDTDDTPRVVVFRIVDGWPLLDVDSPHFEGVWPNGGVPWQKAI